MLSSFYNEKFVHMKRHYHTQKMIEKSKCVVEYNRNVDGNCGANRDTSARFAMLAYV